MEILIISPFFRPNVGGVETHLDDLTNYLSSKKHRIYISTYKPLTTRIKAKFIEKKNNIRIYRFLWPGYNIFNKLEKYPLLEFLYLFPGIFVNSLFIMLFNSRSIDVIHSHGIVGSFVARAINVLYKRRMVVSLHAIYNFKENSMFTLVVKFILSGFDKVLTLSNQSKDQLIGAGIPGDKVKVYTYWVNQEIFKPMDNKACKDKLNWGNRFVVLFVGRFIEIKGMDILLGVAGVVSEGITFVFIGDGPLADSVKEESKKRNNVIFIGKVENKDLPVYYNAADLLCIPSKYEEGFGRVILEAVSCGLPVVGTNKGGVPEAVNDEVGILVEPTREKIKNAIEDLYNNKNKLEILRNNCRSYALERFSESNAKIIEESYG